jgi:DNA repair exonuclease SbcCD ATPase subunit
MRIDTSLVKEMYKSGMGWTEIKTTLVKMDPSYSNIAIAALREICRKEIKAAEQPQVEIHDEDAGKYESVSVLGRPVRIRTRYKNNGVPPEVQDKIQENNLMVAEACHTCGYKPVPGHACAMPSGMCQLGHIHELGFDPVVLMAETQRLIQQYKKPEEEAPAPAKERKHEDNMFESAQPAAKKRIKKNATSAETVEDLEATVKSAEEELEPGNLIQKALNDAGESEDKKIEEVDVPTSDDVVIDDEELENLDMSIPDDVDLDADPDNEPESHALGE